MSKKNLESLKGDIIRKKDSLLRRFDSFYDRKENDYLIEKDYLKNLKIYRDKVKKIIQKLNKKIINGEKKVSNLEYSYRIKEKEEEKLKRLYREIPSKIKKLAAERAQIVKEISALLKEDKLASRDLDKATNLLGPLEENVKKNEKKLIELQKQLKQLKVKRKLLDSVDWTKEELYEQKTQVSLFLKREMAERRRIEKIYRRERAKMDRLMNKVLKKDLLKLLEG